MLLEERRRKNPETNAPEDYLASAHDEVGRMETRWILTDPTSASTGEF
jgi:hypothetical protein